MKSVLAAVLASIPLVASDAHSAALSTKYGSYRDLHRDTAYGSLFFNAGAATSADNAWRKRFTMIVGDGSLNLPSQIGYCFVFNHYGSTNGDNQQWTYSGTIHKHFTDGRDDTDQVVPGTFTSTNSVISSSFPSLCINGGLNNVDQVSVSFTSTEPGQPFQRTISFRVN